MKQVYSLLIIFISLVATGQPYQGGNYQGDQKTGIITGKVKESATGNFVEYATISLYSQRDSSLITGTISLPDGSFTLNELPFGMFYIEATFVGYEKTRLTKILVTPQKQAVDVGVLTIQPSATALEAVEITAERPSVEYKIDKKVISVDQNIASSGGTAVDVLENTPSVQVDIEGNVSLRGSDSFTVLIDGKPSILKGSEALQQLPASAIQNIEIITNPSAKFDPDGSAGIINIIMKKQKQAGINGIVNATVSTNGSYGGDFLFNMRKNKINYTLGAEYNERYFGGTGYFEKEIRNDSSVFTQIQNSEGTFIRNRSGVRGGIEYSFTPMKTFSLSGEINSGEFGRDNDSYNHYFYNNGDGYYFFSSGGFGRTRDSYEIKSDYIQKFNDDGHQILASFQYSDEVSDELNNRREDTTNSSWEKITRSFLERTIENDLEKDIRGKIDYTWPISENKRFEAGYQYRNEFSSADYSIDTTSVDFRIPLTTGEYNWIERPELRNEKDFSDVIHSVYTTYSTNVGTLFDVQAGFRAEYNNRVLTQNISDSSYRFKQFDLFPSIHISKKLPRDVQLQASYTRRVRRPNDWQLDPFKVYIDSLNIRIGNPALKPEYTNSFELNMQKGFKGAGFVSVELFHRSTLNKITQFMRVDSLITINTMENLNSDYSTGAELMVNVPFSRSVILNGGASLYDYRIKSDLTGDDQTFSWNLRFSGMFRFKWGMQAQLTGFYHGPQITAQGSHKGGFFTNLGVRQDLLKKKLTLSLQMRDLLGTARFENYSEGKNFSSISKMKRQAQVLTFSVSYKINNYQKKRGDAEQVNETEFDGGNGGGEMF